MAKRKRPEWETCPGKVIPIRVNLGPPKPGMCQECRTYGEAFVDTNLLSKRPLKGIDPPPKRR